jgi:hypothetical protein
MIRLFGQSDHGKEAFSYGSIWIGSMSYQRHTAACRGRTLDLDKLTQSRSPKLLIEPTGRGRDDRDKDPSSPSCGSLSARTESIHNRTEAVPHELTDPQTREPATIHNPQSPRTRLYPLSKSNVGSVDRGLWTALGGMSSGENE